MNEKFKNIGFGPADILLPKQEIDMTKWSVVACDQYTSEPEYWQDAEKIAGDAPSTFKMILPESNLKAGDVDERIADINSTMSGYLSQGIFREAADSFVLVERRLKNGKTRLGLVGAVDLEAYDYHAGAGSLIRATEGTVLERIPPRVRVREGAALELPHVMLLIDDPQCTVVEPVAGKKGGLEKLYDFELMKDGGHISGYRVGSDMLDGIAAAISALAEPDAFNKKYDVTGRPVLLFAVGDGNHSLATAKECWERVKKTLPSGAVHPARYALVELVNIHDASLDFEPIHRVVFGVEPAKLLDALFAFYPTAKYGEGAGQRIEYVCEGQSGVITVENPKDGLAVGTLQKFLDDYIKKNGGSVDYIHGDDVVKALGSKPGNMGFLLPPMGKSELFRTVITDGVLPRKTFSMGEAHDKRFYLECRKIK